MIFNYNTISVELQPSTKSLTVTLNRPEHENAINIEMLFELEGLFGWLSNHLEVNSVVLKGTDNYFSCGFDQHELSIMTTEKMKKYMTRFQKLVFGMHYLPQTIICDLGSGASGMAIELSLGADIRIANEDCSLDFSCLRKGWISCAGGVSLLSNMVGSSMARQWLLSGAMIKGEKLEYTGFLLSLYPTNDDAAIDHLLSEIKQQAPVARIQTKRAFLEYEIGSHDNIQHNDSRFAFVALHLREWSKTDYSEFTSAREMAAALQNQKQESEEDSYTGPRLV